MDLKSKHNSPVIAEPVPINKSRLGIASSLLPYPLPGAAFSHGLYLTVPKKKTGILDDVRSCSWIDAMKSSSPSPKKTKAANTELAPEDADLGYRTWMVIIP